MKTLASYVLVFLLGWSGAIYSYSDLIYPNKSTGPNVTSNEPNSSSTKNLKLPTTSSSRFIAKNKINKEVDKLVKPEKTFSNKEDKEVTP